jgi:hypothetical protein
MTFDVSNIPAFLRDKDKLATARAEQAELRAGRHVDPRDMNLAQAKGREIAAREGLLNGHDRSLQLAEALFEQGRYKESLEAAEVAGNETRIKEAQEYLEATERPDADNCACADFAEDISGQKKPMSHPRRFVEKEVFVNGVYKFAVRCADCGFVNIRATRPDELQKREVAESQARGLITKGMDLETIKRVLTEAELHDGAQLG